MPAKAGASLQPHTVRTRSGCETAQVGSGTEFSSSSADLKVDPCRISIMLHCIVLYVLCCCNLRHFIALNCAVLCCISPSLFIVLYRRTALCCTVLYSSIVLYCIGLHCSVGHLTHLHVCTSAAQPPRARRPRPTARGVQHFTFCWTLPTSCRRLPTSV